MAYSNKFHSMLLTTGNKSEIAMGYCTLYGDTCGALAPIGDLLKTEVFALCRHINEKSRLLSGKNAIPETILTKPPSAELRLNQTDQDSLPPYEVLDAILKLYLSENRQVDGIATILGMDKELVTRIIQTVTTMQFKRQQMPQVLELP